MGLKTRIAFFILKKFFIFGTFCIFKTCIRYRGGKIPPLLILQKGSDAYKCFEK